MSLNVKMALFKKRTNSTLQMPESSFNETFECVLKDSCDLITPTIKVIYSSNESNPTFYNYALIKEFNNRYYFITNWRYETRAWYADLAIDVLATWKTLIGDSTQYVLRSASTYDGSVYDVSKVPTSSPATSVVAADNPFRYSFTDADGCFIIGVNTGNFDTTTFGVTTFYALNRENMRILAGKLLNDTGYLNVTEISADLQKILYNPLQYISSFFWLPVPYAAIDGEVKSSFSYGWWSFEGVTSKLCGLQRKQFEFTLEFPAHPMASMIGDYLNGEPFTKHFLSFPPFCSDLQIPSNILQEDFENDKRALKIRVYVDMNDGAALMEVYKNTPNNYTIATIRAGLGINLSLMQTARDTTQNIVDIGNIAKGVVDFAGDTIKGALTGGLTGAVGGIMSSASGVLSAADSAIKNSAPKITQLSNSAGSVGYLGFPIKLQTEFYMPTGDANSVMGKPLQQMKKISELSGYVLCANAQFDGGCTTTEQKAIEGFMNGGFFYE